MKADIELLERLAQSGQEVSLDLADNLGTIKATVHKARIIYEKHAHRFFAYWIPEDCSNIKLDGWAYFQRAYGLHSWALTYGANVALYRNLTPLTGDMVLGGL